MKTLVAILALASPLAAAEERTVEASFYCFKYAPGVQAVGVAAPSGVKNVQLSTANISPAVSLSLTSNEAQLLTTSGNATAAKVTIPAAVSKALVVLVPAPAGSSEPYRSFVIDYGREKFRAGTYRLVNVSKHAVRGAIGRSYAEVKSGETGDIELKGENGATQGAKFEFHQGGQWKRLTETRCAVRRDRRWLVLVHEDPATQRMNLRSIPDREAGPAVQPTATAALSE